MAENIETHKEEHPVINKLKYILGKNTEIFGLLKKLIINKSIIIVECRNILEIDNKIDELNNSIDALQSFTTLLVDLFMHMDTLLFNDQKLFKMFVDPDQYDDLFKAVHDMPDDKKDIVLKHLNALNIVNLNDKSDENKKYAYYCVIMNLIGLYILWLSEPETKDKQKYENLKRSLDYLVATTRYCMHDTSIKTMISDIRDIVEYKPEIIFDIAVKLDGLNKEYL
jgi:hypothetical protein